MQILIDLPEELEQEVSFTLTGRALEHQIKTAVTAATAAMTDTAETYTAVSARTTLQQQITAANAKIADLTKVNENQSLMLKEALAEIKTLEAENAALKAGTPPTVPPVSVPVTPPVVTPVPPVSVPGKRELRNVMGITITKDAAPSVAQDTMTKELLTLCGKMGFTHWRGLLNFEEIKSTISMPAFGRQCGMEYVADTVDSQVKRLTDAQLIQYFTLLKKHDARAVYFNDVDALDKAIVIHGWIDRARTAMKAAAFDVPFIGSFTANVDPADYPGFDQYEIQTFTNNITEFKTFVGNKADYLCLPAERDTPLSLLEQILTVTLESGRDDLWVYTAHDYDGTDFRNMPLTVDAYMKFIAKWRAKHPLKPVAPLTA